MNDRPESGGSTPLAPQARERAIEELSARFANDELTLDELERRLERVYKVRTTAELEALFADLRSGPIVPRPASPAAAALTPYAAAASNQPLAPLPLSPSGAALTGRPERMVAVMSNTKRRGAWTAGARLELLGIMSDTTIDLTQAVLPPHDMEIDVTAFMAAVKIVVPRGMPVVSRVGAVMGSVINRSEARAPSAHYPTLHVSGTAVMAEVKVIVRDRR